MRTYQRRNNLWTVDYIEGDSYILSVIMENKEGILGGLKGIYSIHKENKNKNTKKNTKLQNSAISSSRIKMLIIPTFE